MLSPGEVEAIRLSLIVATTAVVCSLPLGVAAGWILARKRFWGKSLMETAINLPLVLPPVVTGYLLLMLFGRRGPIGGPLDEWFGLSIAYEWTGAVLASAVVSFPLLVRAIRSAFNAIDPRIEQAARTCGAGPIDAFFSVSLPLAAHGVVAGCVIAFARAMGEFGATIMIAGNTAGQTRTIPLYVYDQLTTPGGMENSLGVIIASIAIAGAALAAGNHL